jgi:hypothetical protein
MFTLLYCSIKLSMGKHPAYFLVLSISDEEKKSFITLTPASSEHGRAGLAYSLKTRYLNT